MRQQRGFSLIEALIALLVLSIGLIGVAAMQLKALQSANAGYQRSVASVAAVDAQERLWAALAAAFETGQTCEDINISAVQAAWREHWFPSNDATPLRNAIEAQSEIEPGSGDDSCQFTVTLTLSDDDNDQFDYLVRLPSLEPLP